MQGDDFCRGCSHKNSCQETYRRLGGTEGPSVLPKVLLAFLMPMLVFIGCLTASQWALADAVSSKQLRTVLSFLIAAAAAVACAFVAGILERWISSNSNRKKDVFLK